MQQKLSVMKATKETLPLETPLMTSILKNGESLRMDADAQEVAVKPLGDPSAESSQIQVLQSQVAAFAEEKKQLQIKLVAEQKRRRAAESHSANLQEQLKSTWNELAEMRTRLQMKSVSNLSTWGLLAVRNRRQLGSVYTWREWKDASSLSGVFERHGWMPVCYHQFRWGGPRSRFPKDAAEAQDNKNSATRSHRTWGSFSVDHPHSWTAATRQRFEFLLQRNCRRRGLAVH